MTPCRLNGAGKTLRRGDQFLAYNEPIMAQPADGFHLVVKQECPTCRLIVPVMARLAQATLPVTIYSQDDPAFPAGLPVVDDRELAHSYHLNIETVPTLIHRQAGRESGRAIGWDRQEWESLTGLTGLGPELPPYRPGCGARNMEPAIAPKLALRYGPFPFAARRIDLAPEMDPVEACFDRGWSDGLPVVPPTPERVLAMLGGTNRAPDEVVAVVPPDNVSCTVEKAAINAVMAGCRPEYLPVVLAALEAACADEFCLHGLVATTYFATPVVLVNGPVATAIGMNSGGNALGQGNRANATIGRALQLITRNVGGGRPGEVDRATLGHPGKYSFCFAEAETESPWLPLSHERGFSPGTSTVTLFAGDGVQPIVDQLSRSAESLARSFAACLRRVAHPKLAGSADALLVVAPEHARIFAAAGWSKAHLVDELQTLLQLPGDELRRGAGGIAEGLPPERIKDRVTKFRPGGLLIVRAGGADGLFSAVIGGWIGGGALGSQPVTREIRL